MSRELGLGMVVLSGCGFAVLVCGEVRVALVCAVVRAGGSGVRAAGSGCVVLSVTGCLGSGVVKAGVWVTMPCVGVGWVAPLALGKAGSLLGWVREDGVCVSEAGGSQWAGVYGGWLVCRSTAQVVHLVQLREEGVGFGTGCMQQGVVPGAGGVREVVRAGGSGSGFGAAVVVG